MKKAKLMLSSVALLIVVSSALAFQAQRFTTTTLFVTDTAGGCTKAQTFKTTSSVVGTAITANASSTTAACSGTFYTTAVE